MNRKAKRLIDKALSANADSMFGDSGKCAKYDKVAAYVDDWDQVRAYIRKELFFDEELEYFEDAAARFNAAINSNDTEADEEGMSGKQQAKWLAGAGLVGLASGLRYDPNKKGWRVFK